MDSLLVCLRPCLNTILSGDLGMYVSSASGYCSEVSPLALRGITTGAVNLWIVCECKWLAQFENMLTFEQWANCE